MPTVTKTLGEGTQSVLLTVGILECLAGQPHPASLSQIAKTIGTSKSRVFRHLRTLLACDYVVQDEATGRYGIGPRLLTLCRSTADRHDLGLIASPYMESLCERFGHSAIVSRLEAEGVRVVRSVSGERGVVLGVRAGTVLPFDTSAQGKVALAFGAAFAAARAQFEAAHPHELDAIRRDGIAAAQMRAGLTGVAVPIFAAGDRLVGTLALLDTAAQMQGQDAARQALREAAYAISRLFGHQVK